MTVQQSHSVTFGPALRTDARAASQARWSVMSLQAQYPIWTSNIKSPKHPFVYRFCAAAGLLDWISVNMIVLDPHHVLVEENEYERG
ncbi:hypothetical protein FOC34_10165 [Burkholderia multivorans]|uniref:hypothetical protein n=1 Tax=Burkholderia multivorans TaxID=87883 RepID=UPI0012DEC391|nr:hypothetical protein [Burkholderia multivorans]QGR85510.1 hypothetical protein FOC34_10165 [Burkholderia multivorans]